MKKKEFYTNLSIRKAEEARKEAKAAIEVMRQFLSEAERHLDESAPLTGLLKVQHSIVWGQVNANVKIESGIRLVEEANMAQIEANRPEEE